MQSNYHTLKVIIRYRYLNPKLNNFVLILGGGESSRSNIVFYDDTDLLGESSEDTEQKTHHYHHQGESTDGNIHDQVENGEANLFEQYPLSHSGEGNLNHHDINRFQRWHHQPFYRQGENGEASLFYQDESLGESNRQVEPNSHERSIKKNLKKYMLNINFYIRI